MKRLVPGILALVFLVACGGGDSSKHNLATPSSSASAATGPDAAVATRTYPGVGTVKALDPKAPSIEIAHGDIEGLMPAMQMEFDVSDAALLEGLKINDQIDFTIEDRTGIMRVTGIKKR
jgi:Cu/Ag efflux protein CusF